MTAKQRKFVYVLSAMGALGIAVIVGVAWSETHMLDCQEHRKVVGGTIGEIKYTVCYRRNWYE